ncbi:MAG: DUF481 domain-containing protein [Paracoccus sp. (in: a-proteobacteria)]|nr:DUF481 domain-containing protein [Paracoccus sp. (in: a-proteobacteria)]
MKKTALLAGATAISALFGTAALAQQEISTGATATGVGAIEDRLTDVEDAVRDDFARSQDAARFGPADRRQGTFGSVALTYNGSTGNSEAQNLSVAGRVHHNQGPFAQSVGLLIEFSENDAGEKDKQDTYAIYDAQYYFNDQFYAFGLGRIKVDGLAEGENLERDGLLAFGPGYRIINTPTTAWRVQAGVGIRYTKPADGSSDTELGYIASSRFYHAFNDQFFVTNDTDYVTSKDAPDVISNELGLNYRMSDAFSTRVSYRSEYQEDRDVRTDNRLGVSLVYGF